MATRTEAESASSSRLDVAAFLRQGGTVVLEFLPGDAAPMYQPRDCADLPEPARFRAAARDARGDLISCGFGETLQEARWDLCEPVPSHPSWELVPPF